MVLAITLSFMALVLGIFIAPFVGISWPSGGATGSAIVVKEVDTDQQWDFLSQLNVFGDMNANSDRVIAPTSSGRYPFTIDNNARFAVKYTLNVSDENLAEVPMVYRLSTESGTFLCGNDYLWVPIDGLQSISGELPYQSSDGYVLEWKWAESADEVDTAIGVLAQSGLMYTLNFDVSAIQSGPAVGFGIGPVTTGDISIAAFWIALVLVGFVTMIALLCVSAAERRKSYEV